MAVKAGFSLKALDEYSWPVDVKVPVINDEGEGDFEVHRFTGKFKHLSLVDANALFNSMQTKLEMAKAAEDAQPDELKKPKLHSMELTNQLVNQQIDIYMEMWTGWGDDLTDESGKPIAYSDDTKRALLSQSIIRNAVMEAQKDSQGGEAVRRKNLKS